MRRLARQVFLGVSLVAALAVTASAQNEPAFSGAAEIGLGDDVQSVITGLPGEVHYFSFFATKGSRLKAKLVVDAGASLLADLRLTYQGGEVIVDGAPLSAGDVRRVGFAEHTFQTSGFFVLEVRRGTGSGGYELQTKARRNKRIRGLDSRPAAAGTWRFDSPGNSVVDIRVRAPRGHRGSAAPVITGLMGPDGTSIPIDVRRNNKRRISKANDIILASPGTYTVSWENQGGATRLRFAFDLSALGGGRRDRFFAAPQATAPTAPDLVPSTLEGRGGYAGSAACAKCHDSVYLDWSQTAHNLGYREWQQGGLTGLGLVNDHDGNGRNDFEEGISLQEFPDFAAFGSAAPTLSYSGGEARPAEVTIGAVTYSVESTMGGNGLHQQAYVARIGEALYPLPFQYDEKRQTYTAFESDFWYVGTTPRYTSADQVGGEVSYEARCAGCHTTGLVVETRSGGEIVSGWSESDIGCEQCHGPGAEHAATGNPAFIQNPADLVDGTAAGVAAANETCARCHDRGHGATPIAGSTVVPAYPYDAAQGVPEYGDDLDGFFVPTTDPDDFMGYKPALVAGVPGDGFVTGAKRNMQSRENAQGHHAPKFPWSPTCFECHSPHKKERDHMLAPVIDRGGRVETQLADNSYCLACHATHGPFDTVPVSDVQQLSRGAAPQSIIDATTLHMADNGMAVASLLYDPEGTGVGRCDTCHMPRTAGEGAMGEDAAGFAVGDHASHGFANVWPRASELYGTTNSCNVCHPTRDGDPVQAIIEEWARPGADGDTTFHADTPRSFQNGVKNPSNNVGGLPCVQCHTSEGFIRIQVRGEDTDQEDWNQMLGDAIAHDEGISCRACHGQDSEGNLGNGRQPLRFPKAELCGRCHNDETVKFGDFRDEGEIVRHPQREMLLGTAGSEVPGAGPYSDTVHSLPELFPDNCVDCHFDHRASGDPAHDFEPRTETCAKCHDGLDTFNRPANGDYDGSGSIDGIQDEVSGLLQVLIDGMIADDPNVRFENGRFEYGDSNDGSMTGATDAQKRAAFNYYTVVGDASLGVHNAIRTVQLLQRSYEEVLGVPVPGADLR